VDVDVFFGEDFEHRGGVAGVVFDAGADDGNFGDFVTNGYFFGFDFFSYFFEDFFCSVGFSFWDGERNVGVS